MDAKILVLILVIVHSTFCDPDYYWRPYFGTIPDDAVPGTPDKSVYIGHAPLGGNGAILGEIFAGNPNITLIDPSAVIRDTSNYVMILCSGSLQSLVWSSATYENLDSLSDKVLGGFEYDHHGALYVGRAVSNGVQRIGKISGYNTYLPYRRLHIPENGASVAIDEYEVLRFLV